MGSVKLGCLNSLTSSTTTISSKNVAALILSSRNINLCLLDCTIKIILNLRLTHSFIHFQQRSKKQTHNFFIWRWPLSDPFYLNERPVKQMPYLPNMKKLLFDTIDLSWTNTNFNWFLFDRNAKYNNNNRSTQLTVKVFEYTFCFVLFFGPPGWNSIGIIPLKNKKILLLRLNSWFCWYNTVYNWINRYCFIDSFEMVSKLRNTALHPLSDSISGYWEITNKGMRQLDFINLILKSIV